MRSTQTFSVLFWIYSKRALNNKANIYARITLNGKKVNISLKYKVNIDNWDAKAQTVKGKNVSAKEINLYLDEVRSGIMQCYRDLKMEKKILTADLLKSRYLGEDKIHHSLIDIFEYHNEKMVNKIKGNTMGHYKTTQRYILTYLKEKHGVEDVFLQNAKNGHSIPPTAD